MRGRQNGANGATLLARYFSCGAKEPQKRGDQISDLGPLISDKPDDQVRQLAQKKAEGKKRFAKSQHSTLNSQRLADLTTSGSRSALPAPPSLLPASMLLNRLYFRLKPLIPRRVRLGVRRWFVHRKRQRVHDVWPIMPGSEQPPNGWQGWPHGKKFAFVLTHDVESRQGLDRVKKLAELEMELGFRSSFNLIPEGPYPVPAELRDWLNTHGFEVGVHDLNHDGHLFFSQESFRLKAQRINHYLEEWNTVGFRSGYMLRNLDWIHDLNIAYDACTFDTDPFEAQPDGVNTIFPFWVARGPKTSQGSDVSSINDQHSTLNHPRSGYVELPYTLPQDSTLFLILREKTNEIWKRKLDWVAENGGMALLNVHPDYLLLDGTDCHSDQYPHTHYRELLEYVYKAYSGEFWHPLPREVANYYTTTCLDPAVGRCNNPAIQSLPLPGRPEASRLDCCCDVVA